MRNGNDPRHRPQARSRDARAASAFRIRISEIEAEMESCVRLTEALRQEHDELAETRHRLTMALWQVEQRLAAHNPNGVAA